MVWQKLGWEVETDVKHKAWIPYLVYGAASGDVGMLKVTFYSEGAPISTSGLSRVSQETFVCELETRG